MDRVRTYLLDLEYTIEQLPLDLIDEVIVTMHEARINNRQIFIFGNGGSASTASHFVCDLAKNTRHAGWPNFKVLGLADNMALLSAYANDEGYENVFVAQLANFVQPGDIVVAISTSGNSENVVRAIQYAKEARAYTIGFTGFDSGRLESLVDVNLHVPSSCIEHVEDVHLMLEHLICKALREMVQEERLEIQSASYLSQNTTIIPPTVYPHLAGISQRTESRSDRANSSLELLYSLAREMSATSDLGNLLQSILKLSIDSLGAGSGSIMVLDDNGEVADAVLATAGKVQTKVPQSMAETIREGLAGWVVQNRQAALVPRTQEDPRWLRRSWDEKNGSRSALSVPLINGERVLGVMTLVHAKAEQFTEDDLVLMTAIAVCVSFLAPRNESNL